MFVLKNVVGKDIRPGLNVVARRSAYWYPRQRVDIFGQHCYTIYDELYEFLLDTDLNQGWESAPPYHRESR